jgi:predicted cupin superfamily sugar epimerase
MTDATWWIEKLQLVPHPEGGYFRRVYTATGCIDQAALPPCYRGPRPFATAIYYLLPGHEFSSLHRLQSDELWHFYYGSSLTLHSIDEQRRHLTIRLGSNPEAGQSFQAAIKAGWWFGATVDDPAAYALVGCTVSPGFEFADFEIGKREVLLREYPEHASLIVRLTRQRSNRGAKGC